MTRWMAALALIALPVTAQAQTVAVKRGEAVTLIMGDDDALHLVTTEATTATDYEINAAAEFQRGDYNAGIGAESTPMASDSHAGVLAPTPPRGKVILRFIRPLGKDSSLLLVQNGLGGAFVYRATMTIAGKRQPTDVCRVPPGRLANEYWPHPIDSLDLSDFRLVPWSEGDRVVCE